MQQAVSGRHTFLGILGHILDALLPKYWHPVRLIKTLGAAALFRKCLTAKKNLGYKFILTRNGKIFLEKVMYSPKFHINNEDELKQPQDGY